VDVLGSYKLVTAANVLYWDGDEQRVR